MKIKTKLVFGIIFLFTVFLIVGGSSLYFTLKISKQNRLIMKDNHLSLTYTENMLQAIDKINTIQTSYIFNSHYLINHKELSDLLNRFEQNLLGEKNNITEIGEKEQVELLKFNFDKYKTLVPLSLKDSISDNNHFYFSNVLPTFTEIKTVIFAISDLNMQAIVRKYETANETASHSYLILSALTTICTLVFFSFIFSFPTYITNPIKQITESVREIGARNFAARVHFATHDEFGEIANAFNKMASSLEEFEDSQTRQSFYGKKRAEAVMDKLKEAVILLDERQHITFINTFAEKLLGLTRFESVNKYAPDVALDNEELRSLIKDLSQDHTKKGESILLEYEGKKIKFVKEITMIASSKKDSEIIVPIGHMILLKNAADEKTV
jgi:PAS domain S-box-containing protein